MADFFKDKSISSKWSYMEKLMAKNSKLFSWGQVTVYWNFHWLNFYMEIYGSKVGTCGGWLVSFSLVFGNSRLNIQDICGTKCVHERFHR